MVFSKAGEHAIRVALHLASEGQRRFIPVRELAERSGAPYHFLAKLCQKLTRAGILDSSKGPNGGIALALPAAEITLLAVVQALGGMEGFRNCVLGLPTCNDESPCPLHDQWAPIKQRILRMLEEKNLAELAEDLAEGRASIDVGASGRAP